MSSRVAVVTDSTSYLPPGVARQLGIAVVPVQVIVGGAAYDETEDLQAQRVADALADWQTVTTSRPTPERFLQAYAQAIDEGAEEIVVATLSSSMSATYESALLAAREFEHPVRVVDSRSIAMGLGFGVITGARMAATGAGAGEIADAVAERCRRAAVYFYVDTLEYLRRGGRISSARAAVGQALQVKPILTIEDGSVVRLEQVRTAGRALARMEELAVASAEVDGPFLAIAVQHLAAPERAAQLADRLRGRLPGVEIVEAAVGGVVGAHVGPGMVAVVVSPDPQEPADGASP